MPKPGAATSAKGKAERASVNLSIEYQKRRTIFPLLILLKAGE
jgi:hypothetical protein